MIYIIIFLVVLLLVSIWFIFNLLNQTKELEKVIDEINQESEVLINKHYNVIYSVLKLSTEAKMNMDRVDHRGAFKTDDEVGFTFTAIQSIVDTLAAELNKISDKEG